MSKYPELANKSEWTPKLMYIHKRAMIIGGLCGFMCGTLLMGIIWILI